MPVITLCILAVIFIFVSHQYFGRKAAARTSLVFALSVGAVTLVLWFSEFDQSEKLEVAQQKAEQKIEAEPKTVDELIEQIENQLREDRNNSKLWYELGHGYLASDRFEDASLCFSYVLRLEDTPAASVLAAKATADYYANSQRINKNIQALLTEALEKDEFNYPALMLIGNDHFISFRYQEAIDTWQKILDSERQGLDRVTVINSINRAKAML
ncbi:hypothetical protein L3Q72_07965 [Vibrio sp. JC009]|uniref:hypothetical protein n=1 Tax=Vibrio sp. JC009 TaxID=2912314 RepID=UPI0023B056F2|nr:hypothetical protein [Vibrio sp. JC009]WED20588.1 hypothetical protein L3Q72_07965 [Vibrio sp. JC009]